MIEQDKEWQKANGMYAFQVPHSVRVEASELRKQGHKSNRAKGNKHLNEVAYQGFEKKVIPRWAVNKEYLIKIKKHQVLNMDPKMIFGEWGPKVVETHFKDSVIFSRGTNTLSYKTEEEDKASYYNKTLDRRGSSEDWNDASEFATPVTSKFG